MEYYADLKKKKILSHTSALIKFKDIMLCEISQSQKDKYCLIPLIRCIYISKIIETESWKGSCQMQRREGIRI